MIYIFYNFKKKKIYYLIFTIFFLLFFITSCSNKNIYQNSKNYLNLISKNTLSNNVPNEYPPLQIVKEIKGEKIIFNKKKGIVILNEKYNNISLIYEILKILYKYKISFTIKKNNKNNSYKIVTNWIIQNFFYEKEKYFSRYKIIIKKNKKQQILSIEILNFFKNKTKKIDSILQKKEYCNIIFFNKIILNLNETLYFNR